jgi:GH24 family phage-related lysozyme (muramidase)
MGNEHEAASTVERWIDLAKVNQDQLWQRRQYEWKINFGLWAGLAALPGLVYLSQKECSLSPTLFYWVVCIYGIVLLAYACHLIGLFISNEEDLQWMHHFKDRAEALIAQSQIHVTDRPPKFHTFVAKVRHYMAGEREPKLHAIVPHLIVTLAIAAASLVMLWSAVDWRHSAGSAVPRVYAISATPSATDTTHQRKSYLVYVSDTGRSGSAICTYYDAGERSFRHHGLLDKNENEIEAISVTIRSWHPGGDIAVTSRSSW